MKNIHQLLIVLLVLATVVGCFAACDVQDETPEVTTDAPETETESESEGSVTTDTESEEQTTAAPAPEFVDFASQLKFNKNSGRLNVEVTVHAFIDGDTTHFNVPTSVEPTGILKARYLGINTPESTGIIEPWGKKASNYTKETLSKATSIIIESDNDKWNADSTGGRYLVWVWYKTAEMTEYRNLNLEILQQGLAFGSNAADNAYSEYTMGALNQAKQFKCFVCSKDKDPEFYYGGAQNVTLKELKLNYEPYKDKLVRFEAVVVKRSGATVYLEEYDAETDMYYGMQVFCCYNTPGNVMQALSIGNRVMMVGTLQYYELGGTWQISNIKYSVDMMDPTGALSKDGIHKISEGFSPSYREVSATDIVNGKLTLDVITQDAEGNEISTPTEFKYGDLAHYSTVTVKDLTVASVYTTTNETSDDKGAMSITCTAQDGTTIVVRTEVLLDAQGNLVTQDIFPAGTKISVRGIVDSYDGQYQVRVFSIDDITIG
ncbi:MAG: thermonuclease family protein [Clostridia bacterium]|nr:thermonuclease family protein [Clostridia bacterium]